MNKFFHKNGLIIAMSIFALGIASCKESTFSGGTKRTETKPISAQQSPGPTPKPGEPPRGVPPPTDCGPQGITNAVLKTPEIRANQSNQYVRFEMSLTDCFGQFMPIKSKSILFDLDISLTGAGEPEFTITDETGRNLLPPGIHTLKTINGSDLFGNTGNFQHNRTDQDLNLSSSTRKIIFSVNMSNKDFSPRIGGPNAAVGVYLRFADATVNQQTMMVYSAP